MAKKSKLPDPAEVLNRNSQNEQNKPSKTKIILTPLMKAFSFYQKIFTKRNMTFWEWFWGMSITILVISLLIIKIS